MGGLWPRRDETTRRQTDGQTRSRVHEGTQFATVQDFATNNFAVADFDRFKLSLTASFFSQ
jgi:hypothetical protein